MTVIRDRELLAVLKSAEALAREIAPRDPHLFVGLLADEPATPAAADDARPGEEEAAASGEVERPA